MDQDQIADLRRSADAILPIGTGRRADAVDVLTRAFAADPMMTWLLPPGPAFHTARRRLIDLVVGEFTVPLGHTYLLETPEAGPAACAAWQPPSAAGAKMSLGETLQAIPGMIRIAGLSRFPRMIAAMNAMDRNHPLGEPHYYLYFLGVDPRFQGLGLGSLALEKSLVPVDAAGLPCYLENSNPRNTPLYNRHGFRSLAEFRARGDAPPMLAMWRDARG